MQDLKFDLRWSLLSIAWTGFIVYALTSEPSAIPKYRWFAFDGADKVIHAILFGVEAFLVSWSLTRIPISRLFLYVLLWSFALGGGLELIQHNYVEGRSGEPLDFLADMIGALFGLFGFLLLFKFYWYFNGRERYDTNY